MTSWGEPAYRTKQIWQGLYQHFYSSPLQFPNIPKPLREKMADELDFTVIEPVRVLDSSDKQTRKTLFKLHDGHYIEAVLMRYGEAPSISPQIRRSRIWGECPDRREWTRGANLVARFVFPPKPVVPWAVSSAPQARWASNVIFQAARSWHRSCTMPACCTRKDQPLPILY